jgi:hypothetical protein
VYLAANNEILFQGLFQRLYGSGLHPVLAGELAAANYPTDEHKPLRAVRCRQEAVHWHTEEYLDKGTASLEETWLSIWGVGPLDYMGVAPGSPGARELGLGITQPSAESVRAPLAPPARGSSQSTLAPTPLPPPDPPAPPEADAFANAFWLAGDSELKRRYSGAALPKSAPPMAKFFADLMCGVAHGFPSSIDETRKGHKVMGFYPKPPESWWEDMVAVGVGFSIYMLSDDTKSDLLVSGVVGDYYRTTLGSVHPDLAAFVALDYAEVEPSQMLAKLGRIIGELSDRHRVKWKRAPSSCLSVRWPLTSDRARRSIRSGSASRSP